jgi:plastocyanin
VSRARAAALLLLLGAAAPAAAQSLVERPPNLQGVWSLARWAPLFVFSHRFEFVSGGDELVNIPTLTLALGLPGPFDAGLSFTSNSDASPTLGGNETQYWLRATSRAYGPLSLSALGAYNSAAGSADGALSAMADFGRVALLGEVRGFSDGFGRGEPIGAAGVGAVLRLTPRLAVSGDVIGAGGSAGDPAWSAGVAIAIPGTPHTLSLHATNAGATTLQGTAREKVIGPEEVRFGFTFTVPLGTGRQWTRIFSAEPGEAAPDASADTVRVTIRDVAFQQETVRIRPGQVVVWVNADPLAHTATADDGSWDSRLLQEGEEFARRFDTPGEYAYHCTPHPQMRARVIVSGD